MQSLLESIRVVKSPTIPSDDGGDWEDYRAHLEAEESYMMMDRHEEMEKIRRADFNAARSAACQIQGIAAALRADGRESVARRLMAAADDVMGLVDRYA